ncbi:Holliday junction branch migration protein RuvA [Aquiluna sp. KACHI24]|uniref:Holliday junction branch migration protein RuvA n=1 Tax=Aquiluna sp. KACHI24 TaxID=2968831 RepID=UPI0021FD0410|nr:Holliday junction branch migration protein RuvA [Aquiluna sp. KACHI24]BDQ00324.1 Holliday junction ATP-dependent DNA helicase RuvA [Aquiluna sp. KACHI24]
MISSLTGELISLSLDRAHLSVSGVGFEIAITPRHSLTLRSGEKTTLHTRLIVREDELSLYGFQSSSERELFDQLVSVNGIGPKLALGVLAGMPEDSLRSAIANQDEAAFRAISGIGPKTAKLIILQLSGKVTLGSGKYPAVMQALTQLGTNEAKAQQIVSSLDAGMDDSKALKQALAKLSAGKLGHSE